MADKKKSEAPDTVTVVLRNSSPGHQRGDEVEVSPEVAAFLVENKLARLKG